MYVNVKEVDEVDEMKEVEEVTGGGEEGKVVGIVHLGHD